MVENNCEEIIDQNLIDKALENFPKHYFKKLQHNSDELKMFLSEVLVPRHKQQNMCEDEISELLDTLKRSQQP